jgi:hypothetical protein
LQQHACRLIADASFAATREHLRALLGVSVCAESLRTLGHRHGRAMARWQPEDEVTAEQFRQAQGAVEFAVDAGKVNTREEGWKDTKIGVMQKREAGQPVLPGAWDKQRLPSPTSRVAFAAVAPIKRFRRSWRKWSERLGVVDPRQLRVLGDGASWIWKAVDRVFPGSLQVLDVYHACERLALAATRLYGEGTAEAAASLSRARELLLAKGWVGFNEWVGGELTASDTPERRSIIEKAVNYFVKHTRRMDYAAGLASGRAIGSGAVEGQAKTLGLRLKARGARWNIKNVRGMASLICVRNSDQWQSYWANAA